MRVNRRPVLAALAMAAVLNVAACIDHWDPTGPNTPEPETDQDDGGELRAGYASSGGMLVGLPS
jgi:hypothetical protein